MSARAALRGVPPWDQYGFPFTREPLARTGDPAPSHDAAAGYLPHAKAQQAQIHAYLIGVGPYGATAREIAEALARAHPTADPRRGWTIERVDRRMAEMRDGAMISTYNGGEDPTKGRVGPGHLAPKITRDGCCVHIAREYAQQRAA